MLELDHIFCFCHPSLPEVAILERNQFLVGGGKVHPGQGTSNQCVYFQQNFLELIYLSSEEEAKNNFLKLHQRSNFHENGASPFGIALRGSLNESDSKDFEEYKPDYLPHGKLLIHKNDYTFPLLFMMPENKDMEVFYPINKSNIDKTLLDHPNRATNIQSVVISGPNYRWPLIDKVKNISFSHSDSPLMRVVTNGKFDPINLNKSLQLQSL